MSAGALCPLTRYHVSRPRFACGVALPAPHKVRSCTCRVHCKPIVLRIRRMAPALLQCALIPFDSQVHLSAVTGGKSYKHLVGKDGCVKSVVRKGDEVIDAATLGPQRGKQMRVASGRHAGLDCKVVEVDTDGREGAHTAWPRRV